MFIAAMIALAITGPPQEPAKPRRSSALIVHTDITIPRDEQQFLLTSPAEGVKFDLNGDGIAEQTAWTAPRSKLAFVALDRNGNGRIDNGTELLGEHTVAGAGSGINSLTEMLDAAGAPRAGSSLAGDPLYDKLLLWEDRDHNGLSETGELRPARELFTQIGLGAEIIRSTLADGNVVYLGGWVEIRTGDAKQGSSQERGDHQKRIRKMLEIGFLAAGK